MPTIVIGEFKMRFYSNDHPPAHVHCINGDGIAVIDILSGIVRRRTGGITDRDVSRAVQLVQENRDTLLRKWLDFELRKQT